MVVPCAFRHKAPSLFLLIISRLGATANMLRLPIQISYIPHRGYIPVIAAFERFFPAFY